MGHSQAEKAASRERVLRVASRKVREDGLAGPGVAEIMQEAGLTHGGFYKHFASREDLIAQAAAAALAERPVEVEELAGMGEQDRYAGIVDTYLGREHRGSPGTGCALVTLGAAAGRGDQALRTPNKSAGLGLVSGRCRARGRRAAGCSQPRNRTR
ncbi:TetR family transcriptional regulator [Streptomyces sp. NPDC008092]|uniref:TetR/AcrR family transcriptional regulator n=1 Tax=Streptomyces sp. NPDC008092 TaxID=3364808 RepID=UPI0036E532EB